MKTERKLHGHGADVEVVRKLRYERDKEPEGWKQVHVGGMDGISCQHLQEMMTQLVQKHWEWQKYNRKNFWHGSERTPTMYEASINIKTAFDVAKPKRIAEIVGGQDAHGRITAALS